MVTYNFINIMTVLEQVMQVVDTWLIC